jgi:hypothetical protein
MAESVDYNGKSAASQAPSQGFTEIEGKEFFFMSLETERGG